MAKPIVFSEKTIKLLASQIGAFAPTIGLPLLAEDNPELGETIQVWVLPANAVLLSSPLKAAEPNGKWHHQIYKQGKPALFAYSKPFGPREQDWQITAVFKSDIPNAINQAIEVTDLKFTADEEVRLLIIPAYNLQVIWIQTPDGNNFIIPAVVAMEYQDSIKPFISIKDAEFFDKLKEVTHTQGIIL
jgi:hypothetical protein